MGREIILLHTNDYHAQLRPLVKRGVGPRGGGPERAALIRSLRRGKEGKTVLVDAGDFSEGSLAATLTRGQVVIDEMNLEGYDLAVPGNHDFALGMEALHEMARRARFPLLAANVADRAGKPIPWLKPYVIRDMDQAKVAFIGVTTPQSQHFLPEEERDLIQFLPPFPVVKETIRQAREEGANVVVLVSHLGYTQDEKLAAEVPEIDVIVGGHNHAFLSQGHWHDRTLITQTGSHGEGVGEIRLTLDEAGNVASKEARVHPVITRRLTPEPEVARLIEGPLKAEEALLNRVVGRTDFTLRLHPETASNFQEILADAVREAGNTPFALVDSSLLAQEIRHGEITAGRLYTALPKDEKVMTVRVSGKDLKKALEDAYDPETEGHLVSSGNREEAWLIPSGFSFELDPDSPKGSRISNLWMGDRPWHKKKIYELSVNAVSLKRVPSLGAGVRDQEKVGIHVRRALEQYILKHSPLDRAHGDGRIGLLHGRLA